MTQLNAKAVGDSNVLQLDDTRYSRLGWLLMLGGFLGFLGWAALAPLDKGVAVSGKVMVSGHRKVVQHPSGGIVERIDVRDGDKVAAGQVLIRLKETPLLGCCTTLRWPETITLPDTATPLSSGASAAQPRNPRNPPSISSQPKRE